MSNENKSEPAFPYDEFRQGALYDQHAGMTLRDYFAAKAMQGLVGCEDTADWQLRTFAKTSYEIADAMLAERAK